MVPFYLSEREACICQVREVIMVEARGEAPEEVSAAQGEAQEEALEAPVEGRGPRMAGIVR